MKILIFTGNLAAYQSIDLMLEAFALLQQRRTDVLIQIVTNDNFRPCAPIARKLGIEDCFELVCSYFDALPGEITGASVAMNTRCSMNGIP